MEVRALFAVWAVIMLRQRRAGQLHFKSVRNTIPHRPAPRIAHPLRGATQEIKMDGLLIVSFGLLQIADGAITYIGLHCTEIDEANPLASFCFEAFGLGTSIATMKLLGLAFLAFVFIRRHRIRSPWVTATLCGVVAAYCWVVTQNLSLVLAT